MEGKFINRFNSFCNSLSSLKEARNRDMSDSFVLSGTVQKYNLAFDISWKVMKDIIVKYHTKNDFSLRSPREVLRAAYGVGLIALVPVHIKDSAIKLAVRCFVKL